MKFRILQHVNGRTSDGRTFAAGEGTISVIPDDDESMVAMIKDWANRGMVEIMKKEIKKAVIEPSAQHDASTQRGAKSKED